MQYCLTGIGALAFILVYFFLPETWHGETPHAKECGERGKRFVIHRFNPVRSVALLRWPNVAAMVSPNQYQSAKVEGDELRRGVGDSHSLRRRSYCVIMRCWYRSVSSPNLSRGSFVW